MKSKSHPERFHPQALHLTTAQHDAILNTLTSGSADDQSTALALTLMSQLGLRQKDVLNLCRNNFSMDFEQRQLCYSSAKTMQPAIVSVPEHLWEIILTYCDERTSINNDRIFDIDSEMMRQCFHRACAKAKISGINLHAFRSYYIRVHSS